MYSLNSFFSDLSVEGGDGKARGGKVRIATGYKEFCLKKREVYRIGL